jgi:hypothetical protein
VGRKEGWAGGLLGVLREKEEERRWAALGWNERRERGLGLLFFPFLLFFANPFLNQFQTFLDSKLLHLFKFNFNTNLSNYFKGFSQTILTTFQTYFKFKPLHKFSQTISQLFLRTFSQIF